MKTEEKQFSSQSIANNMIARSAWVFGYNVNADHEAALIEDAEFNARALTATRTALEAPAIVPLADLADAADEPELSSAEIAWTAINAVSRKYEIEIPQAIARLVDVDFRGYSPKAVVV